MNILFTGEAPLIKYGLATGFRKLGHEIMILAGQNTLLKKNTAEQKATLEKAVAEFSPDLAVTEGASPYINMAAISKVLKDREVFHVYWAIEDPPHFDWLSLPYARLCDFTFTTAAECIPKYRENGIKASLLLFACNPFFHRRVSPNLRYSHDIALVASNYDCRYDEARYMVRSLVERNYDLKVWGLWWDDPSRPVNLLDHPEKYGGILPYELLPEVYSSAKIVLGIHCDDTSKTQTSMRTFEVLGCGAFYLTQYTPAHENLFKYGKHLVWSKSAAETVKLVDYYLKNEEERQKIARQGQKKVYREHTYLHRARHVLETIKPYLETRS